MDILVNGENRGFAGPVTVEELVLWLALSPKTVLIEHNGLALRRDEWPGRALSEGDRIEIVRIVAGG